MRLSKPGLVGLIAGLSTVFTALTTSILDACSSGPAEHQLARFTAEGELVRPEGYRRWVFVGTPRTPDDIDDGKAPFPELHDVYIDTDSWEHYERTGEFRDGTMLVKELVSVGSERAVSGAGSFMGELIGLEVALKSKDRFPSEPGYWAYFSFGDAHLPLAATPPATTSP